VEASLVDLAGDKQLWKKQFVVPDGVKAFDDFEDQLAIKIAESLNIPISPEVLDRVTMDMGNNTQAISTFLAGELLWAERDEQSLLKALELFQQSIQADSTSTLAKGYRALTMATLAQNEWGDIEELWREGLTQAQQVLRSDPQNPEAYLVMGYEAMFIQKDYQKSENYLMQALQVRPGDAKIRQALAELYLRNGNLEAGREHIRFARIVEPEHRVVRWIETRYLTAFGLLEIAKEANDELTAMYPEFTYGRNFNWQYHLTKDDFALSIEAIAPESDVRYWTSLVYLEQGDIVAFDALYPDKSEMTGSQLVMRHIQANAWDDARDLVRALLTEDEFQILAFAQIADFEMFNKMKSDPEIQRILAEYGIQAHQIPSPGALEL
jgi:tetratricopeptide (TPR) repeat protein